MKLQNPDDAKKKIEESQQALQKALENIERINAHHKSKGEPESSRYKALRITVLFNLAYLHEGEHQLDQANSLYKQILAEQPDYIDASMRLAYLARKRGDVHRCLHWIDEASKSRVRAPINQHCFKGKVLLDMGRVREAGDAFKFVATKAAPEDSYCCLGLANVAFKNALNCRSGG